MGAAKKQQLLCAARTVFLKHGYALSSVDEIAKTADVSKATLYAHFEDKLELFRAVIVESTKRYAERIFKESEIGDIALEPALYSIARNFVDVISDPDARSLYRISLAESPRHPDIGRAFLESGPDVARRRLERFLNRRTALGELEIDDVPLAAQQFVEMCKAGIFHRTMFELDHGGGDEERERIARAAVRTFVRAFAAPIIAEKSSSQNISRRS
ncbi:MAG: TetR/AcrR family transcriptional regulator [Myxococcota bacterium]